jgi:hypothetical protein
MIETRRRHLTVVRSGGKTVGRDAITLPAPMPMSRAPRIAERTLLLYCPEQGGWQTGEWHHDRQCWVSTAAIDHVLEATMWTEAPDEPTD